MNLVFLSIGVKDGSAFSRSFHLAKGLVKLGHAVTLLVSSKEGRAEQEVRKGVRIVTFVDFFPSYIRRGGASPIEMIQRIFFLFRNKFDLIFVDCGFRPTTGVPGYLYVKFKNIPYICEWWDWIGKGGIFDKKSKKYQLTLGLLDDYFEKADKCHADGVVALSHCLKDRAVKLGVPEDRTCVIHGGADVDTSHVPVKEVARAQLSIAKDAMVIGFAGMDDQEVDDLKPFLESVRQLKEKYPNFIWFSTGGCLREDFREKYGVGDEYVEFGWVDYKTYQCCLAAADILLLIQEDTLINRARWPNKLGDYLASNSVILATSIGEVAEFSKQHNPHGIYFTEWNRNSILTSIDNIHGDSAKACEMTELNFIIATSAFSWDQKAVDLSIFMERIVGMHDRVGEKMFKRFWYRPCFDPYDMWASSLGLSSKGNYYAGKYLGKLGAIGISLLDWFFPIFGRKIVSAEPKVCPISLGHEVMRLQLERGIADFEAHKMLDCARNIGVVQGNNLKYSWGLGFPWMSKNGLYDSNIPFITHTPYMMEALLVLAEKSSVHEDSLEMFHSTWYFLESLRIMFDGENSLALSYAPIDEPRMVVNANSYAAFAYALHAIHGKSEIRELAKEKACRLIRWVASQQNDDGSWLYYADSELGNFIDCFHSCFVVKNLLKVSKLLPELSDLIQPVVDKGWVYIRSDLYDKDAGLCRRFATRAQRDPFKLDLYDQAEYLGLLVDFGLLDEATEFSERVEKKFRKGEHWYCRIDIFGRRWGKDFLRWGIVPFWYHQARLKAKNDDH